MSPRIRALVTTSAILLAACSQDASVAPSTSGPARSFAINPAAACNGATMPATECAALVALYNSTNGAAWKSSDNWGVNPNPCTWYGVVCTNGASGSVKELELGNNWLTGPLPAALGNLTALEVIHFHGNAITGPFPSELANLASLRDLNVNANEMTGSLPAWLGNLVNLEVIHVGWNSLSGPIPSSLSNLTSLAILLLNDNQLSGNIPSQLGALTGLYYLELKNNQLTGAIPTELGNLGNLTVLTLSQNELTGSIPASLGNLANAYQILLHGNDLTGLVPLGFAAIGGPIPYGDGFACLARPGNAGLYMPDSPAYRAADTDGDGLICSIPFSPAGDIGEDAVDEIEELVPDVLNEGQANALQTKIDNAMEKAAKGQYGAAINQMQAFLTQLNDMVTAGTLTPGQAAPFIDQAESLIAIWTEALP